MSETRPKAISIRQPWAWAVIHAGKDVENRSEAAVRVMAKAVGQRIFIHASLSNDRTQFEQSLDFLDDIGVARPAPGALERGGIIGSAKIECLVTRSDSPWFFGPCALRLVDPRPLPFFAVRGQLNLFYVDAPQGMAP